MHEYGRDISGEKRRAEAGVIRVFVAVCLVLVGFIIAFWVLKSVHQRLASSSLMERLPFVIVLLLLCVVVFVYARVKRERSKDPEDEPSQEENR